MSKLLFASLAVLALATQARAAETTEYKREAQGRCVAATGEAGPCAAKAEIEDAARCALANMRTASAVDEGTSPDPFRIVSDRKEALRLVSEGSEEEALVIAQGTRTLAGAACSN